MEKLYTNLAVLVSGRCKKKIAMEASFYFNNRQRFFDRVDEDSVTLLYSGTSPVKSNDQKMHPFSVNRNFFYLTGIEAQNVWLVLAKTAGRRAEYLFIDQPDEEIIRWNGKMLTREEACARSGISDVDVRYMQDMDRVVGNLLYNGRSLTAGGPAAWFSFDRMAMGAVPTPSELYSRKLKELYPFLPIRNIAPLLSSLRSVKTEEEIQCIRKAGETTIEALRHMLRTARSGEQEYQWAADYEYYVARAGQRSAFTTIAASGANATMLHYSDNNCAATAGDLILFDLGAEYQNYSADVSRTFPVNGKFTARQRELFLIVREAMDLAKDKMRPGMPLTEPNQAVVDFYKKALRTAKLISDDSDVRKYYYHSVSHSLGLDTHDPCDRKVYEPGMVVTCEPGLYVAEEGIGIRLENDILVTEGAPVDLIGNLLLDVSEIEALMAR